jgi:hypothetical protein
LNQVAKSTEPGTTDQDHNFLESRWLICDAIFSENRSRQHFRTAAVTSRNAVGQHKRKSSWQVTGHEHLDRDKKSRMNPRNCVWNLGAPRNIFAAIHWQSGSTERNSFMNDIG